MRLPHRSPVRRTRLLGVAAAAVLLGALVVTGRLLDEGREPGAAAGSVAGAGAAAAPKVLPVSAPGVTPPRLCQAPCGGRLRLLDFTVNGFTVPPGMAGVPGSLGALTILAVPARDAAGGRAFRCQGQRPIATAPVHGQPAALAACPEGSQGWAVDSLSLRWSQRGTFVAVGLRGAGEPHQRLIRSLADHLRLVGP